MDTMAVKLLEQFTADLGKLGIHEYIIVVKDPDRPGNLIRFNGSIYWQRGAALDIADRCRSICREHWRESEEEGDDHETFR